MLALEKCRVIAGCGSGAYFSVLSGKRHQGRTVQRASGPKKLAARLLVRDANSSIPLYGLHSPIIPPSAEWAVPKRTVGEWVRFDDIVQRVFAKPFNSVDDRGKPGAPCARTGGGIEYFGSAMQTRCEECRRLIPELTSATTETVAIWSDIIANRRADGCASTVKIQYLLDANAVRQTALEAIQAHLREAHGLDFKVASYPGSCPARLELKKARQERAKGE